MTRRLCVHPEAAARIADLGHQGAFEQMLRQAEALIPGLHRIEADLVPDYDEGGEPGLFLLCLVEAGGGDAIAGRDRWDAWKLAAFPPEVWRHYSLWTTPTGGDHAG